MGKWKWRFNARKLRYEKQGLNPEYGTGTGGQPIPGGPQPIPGTTMDQYLLQSYNNLEQRVIGLEAALTSIRTDFVGLMRTVRIQPTVEVTRITDLINALNQSEEGRKLIAETLQNQSNKLLDSGMPIPDNKS